MATALFDYVLGRNWTVQITPQTVNASGVWSDHSIGTMTFTGCLEQDEFSINVKTTELTPLNAFQSNPVLREYTGVYTLTEVPEALPIYNGTTGSSRLEAALRASFYQKVEIYFHTSNMLLSASGTGFGTDLSTWTMYCLLTDLKRESPKGRTAYKATLQLALVGDGQGGFVYQPSYDLLLEEE